MGNPLMNGQKQQAQSQQQMPDMNKLFNQFRQNPLQYLSGMGIPQGMNDPKQIVTYLADSGKIPPMLQGRVNAMLGRK